MVCTEGLTVFQKVANFFRKFATFLLGIDLIVALIDYC
jgi:hypothetical protein